MSFEPVLVTTRSGMPSPLRSAIVRPSGAVPVKNVSGGANWPPPSPR